MVELDKTLMNERGWVKFENLLKKEFITRLRNDLDIMYEKRRKIQIKNGIGDAMSGTCHFLIGDNNSMDELVAMLLLNDLMKWYFNGNYILNSFGAFINQPQDNAYVSKIHRDVRTFSGDIHLLINILIMLDDFTLDNGATYIASGSHRSNQKPNEAEFYQHAERITGKAGDVVAFDSNTWHAAGMNQSNSIRRGLTLTYSRPFMKPQIDFPRFLGENYLSNCTEDVKQILGYYARVPSTIDEFYQPYEKRFYRGNQEIPG